MAACQFFLPYDIAIRPTNTGVPGAKLNVYAPSTTTRRPAYSTSSLTTQLSNPVIADGAGRFPAIFLDNGLTYKIVITDRFGATLYTRDPYIPGTAPDSAELAPYQAAAEAAADASAASATAAAGSATAAATSATNASNSATAATGAAAAASSYANNASASATSAAASAATAETIVSGIDTSTATVNASTRTILAGLDTSLPAYLSEPGREGQFVWSSSNLSAFVTADTQQGIYVAPSSDTSGASGAWVRSVNGPHNAKWFGLTGDGTTDNLAAWNAIKAYFSSLPSTGYWNSFNGTYRPFPKLFIPIGNYYFSAPCELDGGQWDIECEGNCGQGNGGMGVTFTFAAGNDGVVIQSWNTTGVNGSKTTRAQTYNAQGSRIRGLTVRSLGAGSYSGACGFYTRAIAHLEYCHAVGFPSHGFAGIGSLGAGGSSEGQVSGTSYFQCSSSNNGGHGFFFDGADANSCTIIKCDSRSNGQYGFMDSSFLGNYYFGCAASSNGWDGAAASGIPTACTYLGNRYYVKRGQAAGASTNAPSGTTADNTWWGYVSAGGTFSGIVAWVSGTTFQEGGSYSTDDANASSVFSACYAESDQNPAQIIPPSLIIGGQLSISTAGTLACSIRTDTSGSPILGYKHGSADSTIELANSNVSSIIRFARYTNGGATQNIDAKVWTATGQLILDHVGGSKIAFRLAQSEKMALTTSGLLISAAGYGLGFSTGAGTAVTQATGRTTGVTANASCGAITLVSAAGSTSWQSFTVTNSAVAATDTVRVCQKSGTDKYMIHVTKVAAGSFEITFATTGGTTTEQPVFNFSVIKAVAA